MSNDYESQKMAESINYIRNYINEIVDEAVKKHKFSGIPKNQIIGGVVGAFIVHHLNQFGFDSNLHQKQHHNDSARLDLNALLDSFGEPGIRIGALAFVLTVKLEARLPHDNSDAKDIVAVEISDGSNKLLDNIPVPAEIRISDCYLPYIHRDEFVFNNFFKDKTND